MWRAGRHLWGFRKGLGNRFETGTKSAALYQSIPQFGQCDRFQNWIGERGRARCEIERPNKQPHAAIDVAVFETLATHEHRCSRGQQIGLGRGFERGRRIEALSRRRLGIDECFAECCGAGFLLHGLEQERHCVRREPILHRETGTHVEIGNCWGEFDWRPGCWLWSVKAKPRDRGCECFCCRLWARYRTHRFNL